MGLEALLSARNVAIYLFKQSAKSCSGCEIAIWRSSHLRVRSVMLTKEDAVAREDVWGEQENYPIGFRIILPKAVEH